jgi:hypothetical protein
MKSAGVRLPLVLTLLVSLLALVPLADASPPDPWWTPGFYDDDDHDDVVNTVTSTASAADCIPLVVLGPCQIVVGLVVLTDPASPAVTALPGFQIRAPPDPSSLHSLA